MLVASATMTVLGATGMTAHITQYISDHLHSLAPAAKVAGPPHQIPGPQEIPQPLSPQDQLVQSQMAHAMDKASLDKLFDENIDRLADGPAETNHEKLLKADAIGVRATRVELGEMQERLAKMECDSRMAPSAVQHMKDLVTAKQAELSEANYQTLLDGAPSGAELRDKAIAAGQEAVKEGTDCPPEKEAKNTAPKRGGKGPGFAL